jgi:hypothetical protein
LVVQKCKGWGGEAFLQIWVKYFFVVVLHSSRQTMTWPKPRETPQSQSFNPNFEKPGGKTGEKKRRRKSPREREREREKETEWVSEWVSSEWERKKETSTCQSKRRKRPPATRIKDLFPKKRRGGRFKSFRLFFCRKRSKWRR